MERPRKNEIVELAFGGIKTDLTPQEPVEAGNVE